MRVASNRQRRRAPYWIAPGPYSLRASSAGTTFCAAMSRPPTRRAPDSAADAGLQLRHCGPAWRRAASFHVAIRSDRMHIKSAGKRLKAVGSGNSLVFSREALESRVAAVEYQGAIVKLRLESDWGDELTVTLADQSFYTAPLAEGDVVGIHWDDADAHVVS